MTILQALLLALLQGVTELFPISSLGHAVIVPALLHWDLDEGSPTFLPFLVMLHVGTAAALLAFFWRDWAALARGAVGAGTLHQVRESRHILGLIVLATVPAIIIGYALENRLRTLFAAPEAAALFLVANGVILLGADRLRTRLSADRDRPIANLSVRDALIIGCWQCVAFLPGISRAGTTMTGGLLRGINHQTAARFSFLIALPVILAATVSQLLKLRHVHITLGAMEPALLGAMTAGVTAWLSTAFLMRYFRNHEDWALSPFAFYSIAAGLGSFLILHVL